MRHPTIRLALAAVAALAAPGCTDSLGLGTECGSQMSQVRLQYGTPDEVLNGSQSQQWYYDSPPVYFEFDWSSGTCQVTGPSSYDRIPVDLPRL